MILINACKKGVATLLGLLLILSLQAQNPVLTGRVLDENNTPLYGITVVEKGTMNGTTTDTDGRFRLDVAAGTILQISSLGYKTVETQAAEGMVILLLEDTEYLDELVVIGYGSVAKGDITTAVSSISNKEIDQRPITSAMQAIAGKAAGVQITETSGAPDADLSIKVRGITSINGSNSPLYVVDGVVVENLKFLAPSDILNIQI